ncbi:L,D-transpeptidase family protein [Aurantiacibacter poecillastricola]|uniref:L,D-transpeptidase family protein n=1 Tax=Aurantiacibacter poecillastricola TaxID=3064385 RepID=UPI00273E088B|nr:L,D-transpeptidase [Aurantiacibacter sp. 219JJ12-13]MDP5262639.1 L,D-transpeptidase [Aurantiacibacter sp. 219JJ12-13]
MNKHPLLAALLSLPLLAVVPPAMAQNGPGLSVTLPDGVTAADLGERDAQMIAIQVMLDRSNHSPGVIDGYGGGNTRRAIAAYRRNNGLPEGGGVDTALLRSLLDTQTGDIFRTYTIRQDDVDGPFYDVPSDFAEQAELDRVGYEDPREMLAERFHMDQEFLSALNPNVDFSRAGQEIVIVAHGPAKLDAQVARIEIRKDRNEVAVLDGEGNEIATYPATIGSDDFPSPSGRMEVSAVAPEANYTFDPDSQEWGPDKTFIIPPGPNNPIGGTWIDLGENGYGIHGSPDPQLIGKTASHGCVRLTNWDARELAGAVTQGVDVEFV